MNLFRFSTGAALALCLAAPAAPAFAAPPGAAAASGAAASSADSRPARLILVGDSTMASRSGYGDALCQRLKPAVACVNLARGGRSSASFRGEGLWRQVQSMLADGAAYRASYVLIQFGHNDQPGKPGRSTDLAGEFTPNMARYAQEVAALGGVPVLLTPLTRRSFKDGVLENNLLPWAEATRAGAAANRATLLDLNADSHAAVQAMGEEQADTLAMAPRPTAPQAAAGAGAPTSSATATAVDKIEPAGAAKTAFDRTHLGAKGAAYFAAMVEHELRTARPELADAWKQETPP
ncbi:MAG: GDSL-type esterase/lipase family protein [Pseudomonadota bacterium]